MKTSGKETPEKNRPARRKASARKKEKEIRLKKKRTKQIKNLIALAFVICIISGCIVIISNVMSKNEEFEKTNSGDFIDEKSLVDETEQVYKAIPHYKEDLHNRYMAFADKHPEKTSDEVVWMVNANMDMPKYGHDIVVSDLEPDTVIVNKYYRVPDDYTPSDLTTVDGQQLKQSAASAFIEMRNDALKDNYVIKIASGYISVEEQNNIYNGKLENDTAENVDRYCARPGYSEHHTGLAIDLVGSKPGIEEFVNTTEYTWIRDNCYKYGFIIRYTDETEDITGFKSAPWHLRFVGKTVSEDMKEKNITTYEEYYARYLQ